MSEPIEQKKQASGEEMAEKGALAEQNNKAKSGRLDPKSDPSRTNQPSALQNFNWSQLGLLAIIALFSAALTKFGGVHFDAHTHGNVNNFLNANTLLELLTQASLIGVVAVGMTMVIVTAGIDLSVGSAYSLCGVSSALVLQHFSAHPLPMAEMVMIGLGVCLGVGLLGGLLNGLAVVLLDVHPFIITLGTLWIFRGIAFVISKGNSILVPTNVMSAVGWSMGLPANLHPVPMLTLLVVTIIGSIFLTRTPAGRRIFAVGGNLEASRYAGVKISRVLVGVYAITGLLAGLASFIAIGYYGAASSGDGTGRELYVIAAAVVGGVSLLGGKGSALGAVFGAILIELIQESIIILHLNQNYEQIIIGLAIIVAVVIDRAGAKLQAKRLVQARSEAIGLDQPNASSAS